MANDDLTRCAFADFNTCRAQHCGNYAPALSGPPFCSECLSLLPGLYRRRLEREWSTPIMREIEEPETTERVFTRSSADRRSKAATYLEGTGKMRRRQVYDVDAMSAGDRNRLEIETAWLLRKMRRAERARRSE